MSEHAGPPQGQVINRIPQLNATEHMSALRGELNTPEMSAGWDQLARGHEPNEDSVYAYHDQDSGAIFGVFDGMGGMREGEVASSAARDALHETAVMGNLRGPDKIGGLMSAFDLMNARVGFSTEGATTGLVAQLSSDGDRTILTFAAVGDSLGFVVKADGSVIQLNKEETLRQLLLDQGETEAHAESGKSGSMVTNGLSPRTYQGVEQFGQIDVQAGDFVVLTTDGITGDKKSQRMKGGNNETAISSIVADTRISPNVKAQKLIAAATKNDDRTALVVEVLGKVDTYNLADLKEDMTLLRSEMPRNRKSLDSLRPAGDDWHKKNGGVAVGGAVAVEPVPVPSADRHHNAWTEHIDESLVRLTVEASVLLNSMSPKDAEAMSIYYGHMYAAARAERDGNTTQMQQNTRMAHAAQRKISRRAYALAPDYFRLMNEMSALDGQRIR